MPNQPSPPAKATLSVVVPCALLSDPAEPEHIESLLKALEQSQGTLSLRHLRRWLDLEHHPMGGMGMESSIQTQSSAALSSSADRALAQCLNLELEDGLMPWAWHHFQGRTPSQEPAGGLPASRIHSGTPSPVPEEDHGYALVSLCNWHVASGQVVMQPARTITQAESFEFKNTLAPYFLEDGIELFDHCPGTWLARSPLFKNLPSASMERVMGQDVTPWLIGRGAAPLQQACVRTLRRLQSEVQMLLYHHPINDQGLTPLNSIWFSGTGQGLKGWPHPIPSPWRESAQLSAVGMDAPCDKQWLTAGEHQVLLLDDLIKPHWARDLPAWCQAFEQLDREIFSRLTHGPGQSVIFCGLHYTKQWTVVDTTSTQSNPSPQALNPSTSPKPWWSGWASVPSGLLSPIVSTLGARWSPRKRSSETPGAQGDGGKNGKNGKNGKTGTPVTLEDILI